MSLLGNFFKRENSGTVAIIFGLSVIPVMGAAGIALDIHRSASAETKMQNAADAAAIAGVMAEEPSEQKRVAVALAHFAVNDASATIPTVSASGTSRRFTVNASVEVPTAVMIAFGIPSMTVRVTATAERMDSMPACILGLNQTESDTVKMSGNSVFFAKNCAIYSNSSSPEGMVIQGSTNVSADGYCSVGGVKTTKILKPTPQENCSPAIDPFVGLPPPAVNACKFNKVSVKPNTKAVLKAGVYCGGVDLKGEVTMEPGTYVFRDGALNINSQANVQAKDVLFYFTGTSAGFDVNGGGGSHIEAKATGPYGGILFMQDRTSNLGSVNKVNGNSSSRLVGAIYTPTQRVVVNGTAGFGQNSPFMPIVADKIEITGNATVEIDASGIDLPSPLPQMGAGVRLTN